MATPFRVIDTGLQDGAMNIAFDAALLEMHKARAVPDTIRFLHFRPTVLIGRHQSIRREVNLDYCRMHGIGVARRMTGGGALFMDESQFGFELVVSRETLGLSRLDDIASVICGSVAAGLSRLGISVAFRPRNDLEVDGRKIGGTGGFFDGDTIIYQGTILADMDPSRMIAALNVPRAKLQKRRLDSAAQRIVTLRELLGAALPSHDAIKEAVLAGLADHLHIAPYWGQVSDAEVALARRFHDEDIGTDDFLFSVDDPTDETETASASQTRAGGSIIAHVRLQGATLHKILLTGDFFVSPPRLILDLEASLSGLLPTEIRPHVIAFFERARVDTLSAKAEDFIDVIEAAMAGALRPAPPQ